MSSISDALLELQREFASTLPRRLEALRAQYLKLSLSDWQVADVKLLQYQLHSLTGSAGTFGMPSLSDAARRLEIWLKAIVETEMVPDEVAWQTIGTELMFIDQLAHRQLNAAVSSLRPSEMPVRRLDHAPLVYLVEDDLRQAEYMTQELRNDGYQVRVFNALDDFRSAYSQAEQPDAIVLDIVFMEGDSAGVGLLMELKAEKQRCPPVVFVSVRDDLDARLDAYRAGASRYLHKPVAPQVLIDQLDILTGRVPPEPYRVLLVDDDPLLLEAQASVLRAAGMIVQALRKPRDTLQVLDSFQPDVLVLDIYMPDVSGPELAAVVREREDYLNLPILFLSAETEISKQLLALSLGGDDFLVKPVRAEHLIASVNTRARRARQSAMVQQRLRTTLYEREREHMALNHHAMVSITDVAGKIIYANDRFCQISGYSRGELMGENHRVLKSGEHSPEFYSDLWRTISAGDIWHGEICNRRKDGSHYWEESTITPFLDKDGRPYQYVSMRTDITHVKETEARALANEARLDYIMTASPVVLYSCQASPCFSPTFVSENIRELFGYEADYCLNTPDFWLSGIHPDDVQRVLASFEGVLTHKQYEHEYRFRISDGSYVWVHDSMRVVYDAEGMPIEIIGYWVNVDQRVRAEQAAEASKERLRRGQLYANVGTWDWNIVTGELYWTERIAPLFGYPSSELETSYENFLAAVHPDDRQAVIEAVSASVEQDAPYNIEHRVVWPDGTVRWLLERGAVMRDAEGAPLSMLGVVQDIDERKRAEIALAERERQLLEAQSLASLGNWSADLASGELVWSDEIYRIFGYEPGSISPSINAFHAAVHPEDLERVNQSERQAEETGHYDVVHRIVRPDGSIRYVHELAQMRFDELGKAQHLIGTAQDVTELKQAEQDLLIFRRVFDATGQGIGVADTDGYLLYSNPAHDRLHGYEPQESQGKQFKQFFSGKIMQWAPEAVIKTIAEGKSWSGLLPIVRKDGSEVITASNVGFIAGEDGKPQYLFNIMSDYSSELERQQQLAQAKEEADRANQAKSEFLSSMSHELRTPMNAILGFGQLIEYDEALSDEHQDSVREIIKAGTHLLELIGEVLDLSKVESGNIDLSLEPVEVCTVVDECLSLVRPLADQRNIELRHQGLEGVAVRADRTRLKQVLLNLLSNAIKYNREGGSIAVKLQYEGNDRLRIQVIDTGQGISSDRLTELFEPFNRLGAEEGEIEGTGIGLTITQRIVEMMGGRVNVQSELGVGSTFWIELPLESLSDTSRTHEVSTDVDDPAARFDSGTEYTVLYIEDNPSNIKLMSQLLSRVPHIHLLTAHTSELGIELAMARQPDLILMDINMPGMNGYQVLEVLKAGTSLKNTPVIAITANAMPRDIERGKAAGFADYLTKPLNVEHFLDTVKSHLAALAKVRT